jgi:hypothetical protein
MSTECSTSQDIGFSEPLGPLGLVSPSDQLITLTLGQLQDLVSQAVSRATAPILELLEVQAQKIATLEKDQETFAENQLIQLRLINQLRKEPEVKESPLIDELYTHMKAVGLKQTTFSSAAKILKVTRQRVQQLKATIALDTRFIIVPSESHSQKLLIRLREYHKI